MPLFHNSTINHTREGECPLQQLYSLNPYLFPFKTNSRQGRTPFAWEKTDLVTISHWDSLRNIWPYKLKRLHLAMLYNTQHTHNVYRS